MGPPPLLCRRAFEQHRCCCTNKKIRKTLQEVTGLCTRVGWGVKISAAVPLMRCCRRSWIMEDNVLTSAVLLKVTLLLISLFSTLSLCMLRYSTVFHIFQEAIIGFHSFIWKSIYRDFTLASGRQSISLSIMSAFNVVEVALRLYDMQVKVLGTLSPATASQNNPRGVTCLKA